MTLSPLSYFQSDEVSMGVLFFIDDYLNVLTTGTCMKSLYDKNKVPREALAFILDSTGAPTCVLVPISTWAVFYSQLFMEQEAVSSMYSSGISAYIHAIPFCFYPFLALASVLLFALGIYPKIGYMKGAFKRTAETGMIYSERSAKYNHDKYEGYESDGSVWDFIVPMVVLIAVTIISGEILVGVILALVACLLMYVPRKLINMETFFDTTVKGFGNMLSIFFLLVGAFALREVCDQMGMTTYIINLVMPLLTPKLFPAISFFLLGILAFATGSDWGMSAVVIPIFIPLAAAIGANIPLTMASIISGGAFGSHACFYADATVLSSQSSCIDNLEHALTQLPYVLISAGLAVAGFAICGILM